MRAVQIILFVLFLYKGNGICAVKENTNINYKSLCYKLNEYYLMNSVKESKNKIENIMQCLKIIEEHEKILISKKPLIFKDNWKNELKEIEKLKMQQYELIGAEMNFIENYMM